MTTQSVRVATWEDATASTILLARGCLPPVLQELYLPALLNATATATNVNETRLRAEELILFHFYQRLSGAWGLCKALAQGIRMGAYYVDVYQDTLLTTPTLFPRLPLSVGTAACTAAIAALPSPSARTAINDAFRHRFTDGVICLRRHTVHGQVPDYI